MSDIGGVKPGVGVSGMAVEMQKPAVSITPNKVKFDVSIATRISGGKLLATLSLCLRPCQCDENGVWKDCYIEAPVGWSTGNLDQLATDNPDMADVVETFWASLTGIVDAINAANQLA